MSSPHLLRPFPSRQLGLIEGDDRVVVFGVLGGRRLGPTILVHAPTLLIRLDQLGDEVELVVFVEESPDASTVAVIDDMLAAMGPEDGLVQYEMVTEAIKLTRGQLLSHGIDRSTLVSFRPPEVIRALALRDAVADPPADLWVDPAGLVAANGGRIETYPPMPFLTDPLSAPKSGQAEFGQTEFGQTEFGQSESGPAESGATPA